MAAVFAAAANVAAREARVMLEKLLAECNAALSTDAGIVLGRMMADDDDDDSNDDDDDDDDDGRGVSPRIVVMPRERSRARGVADDVRVRS
jgi:hypothetical protein